MLKPVLALTAGLLGALAGAAAWAESGRGVPVRIHASEKPGAAVIEEVELYADSHALVIGIDAYRAGWPRLSMAVADAKAVAAALEAKGFDVTLKLDPDARALHEAFEEFYLARGENPDARLFVWFAGHGHSQGGEGFLIPADAPKPTAGSGFYRKALSLRRIGEYVRLSRAKHAFAVFDSCFAGTVFDTARSLPPAAITQATTLPVRQFLTSGEAGQTVSDDGSFRELFLRALDGEENADANGDGYITASELGLFLTDRVTNLTRTRQTPRYGKLRDKDWDRGDFVFTIPARPARPALAPAAAPAPKPAVPGAEAMRLQQDTVFWESIKDSGDADAYRAYLGTFPRGTFAPLARSRLDALERPRAAAKGPTPKPAEPIAREAERPDPAPPALPGTPETADYVALPVGTVIDYDNGWTIRVTGVDGMETETRSTDHKYRFIHAGAALSGEIGISQQVNKSPFGASARPVELVLDGGRAALAALWPLKVGKSAEYRLRYDQSNVSMGGTYSENWEIVDDAWTVSVTVEKAETVTLGDRRLTAFVFRSTGVARSGRRFEQRHWYHPGSGLIVKLERAWSGKTTENSLPESRPGKVQRFQLTSVRFPDGVKNALK